MAVIDRANRDLERAHKDLAYLRGEAITCARDRNAWKSKCLEARESCKEAAIRLDADTRLIEHLRAQAKKDQRNLRRFRKQLKAKS